MSLSLLKTLNNRSLRFRITLLITLLTAVLTIAFTSYFISYERHEQIKRLQNKGQLLAAVLANSIQIPLYAGNDEEVAMDAATIFSHGDIYSIRIIDSRQKQVLYAVKDHNQADRSGVTVMKLLLSNSVQYSPEALLQGDAPPEQLNGKIELEMDTSNLKILLRKLILISALLALLFWVTVTGITFFLVQKLTKTFQLLMSGVKRIEAGDLDTRIPVDTDDEPGRALAAINSLAVALRSQNEENQRLQAEIVQGLHLQIHEEKTKHMAKLIQTNRMTSLGLLVSSMAHEINNPNGAIRLAAEILERAWKDIQPVLTEVAENESDIKICGMPCSEAMEDIEKAVEAISRSSFRIERVVHNLRTYSLGDRENHNINFDLNRVAENSISIIRAHGNMKSIVINTALTAAIPAVNGNPFQLEQVIINLLMNAIQSMAKNGGNLITLSTKPDSDNKGVLLIVKDSGTGISAENMRHIFEPFFSTRIDQGGSGLGLYIASFIVEEQNGTLELFNDESGGCRAVIRLPAAKPSVTPQTAP